MQIEAKLSDVTSERVRNIVRGVMANTEHKRMHASLESLRRESNYKDAIAAYRYLLKSPLAAHVPLPVSFPNSIQEVIRTPWFEPLDFSTEFAFQMARFVLEEEKILLSIQLLGQLNAALLAKNIDEVSLRLKQYEQAFGLSLFVMRKALSEKHSAASEQSGQSCTTDYLNHFLTPKRQILAVAFEDTIAPEWNYYKPRSVNGGVKSCHWGGVKPGQLG